MPDDVRRFALREDGEETSVFENKIPRQAALKAARRLDTRDGENEAIANPERIHLREHGTVKVHIYDGWAWKDGTQDDEPEWIEGTVTRANVSKVGVEEVPDSEQKSLPRSSELRTSEDYIDITQKKCAQCGTSLNTPKAGEPVETVTSPQVIRYKRYHYKCDNCRGKTVADHPHIASKSQYGENILAQSVLFHFEHRIPYRKTAELFGQLYGFDMNSGGVFNLVEYMYKAARPEYGQIQDDIQSADILHADETSHLVDSTNKWLWGFTTGKETLYALRDSRGSEVLENVIGDDFDGIIICDGHTAYPAFHSQLQRCWSHLLRGTDHLSEDDNESWSIYNELFDIFEGLQLFLETNPTLLQRLIVVRDTRRELRRLTATEVESEDATDVLTMLENGLGDWLTFVEQPDVDPTNNRIEALLREPIKIRRIIGQLQNEKGMRLHETFLSLLQTWKQQNKNPYTELQRVASKI